MGQKYTSKTSSEDHHNPNLDLDNTIIHFK